MIKNKNKTAMNSATLTQKRKRGRPPLPPEVKAQREAEMLARKAKNPTGRRGRPPMSPEAKAQREAEHLTAMAAKQTGSKKRGRPSKKEREAEMDAKLLGKSAKAKVSEKTRERRASALDMFAAPTKKRERKQRESISTSDKKFVEGRSCEVKELEAGSYFYIIGLLAYSKDRPAKVITQSEYETSTTVLIQAFTDKFSNKTFAARHETISPHTRVIELVEKTRKVKQ
jgi:hypothetical protein